MRYAQFPGFQRIAMVTLSFKILIGLWLIITGEALRNYNPSKAEMTLRLIRVYLQAF